MPAFDIYSWLANEANNRAISSVGTVFQIIGIIIPAFIAILVYIVNSFRKERDDVIKFLGEWNSADRSRVRYEAVNLFRNFNAGEITLDQLLTDDQTRINVLTFLNENEFLSLFVLTSGPRSFRRKLAKKFFRGIVIGYWDVTKNFILQLRDKTDSPDLFIEFEKLAKTWKKESS